MTLYEEAGFDVVTVFNDLWFQPSLPALLEIAAATTCVRVGASCLNPFTARSSTRTGIALAPSRGGRWRCTSMS